MFEISVEETFAAGHALRNYRGKCENVHGHNYRIRAVIEGEQLDEAG
ncbi:MAG TPA: 6-carboxytetrahydropterin synthase, partial [Bryobacteraceae bacterium]|nr:6-carboxytetrahydropterin synthase [Bryobacteraceae bacterium]